MAESFLEEQLQRIKALTERMRQVQNRAAELTRELAREREMHHHSPLQDIRDLRTHTSVPDLPPRRRR